MALKGRQPETIQKRLKMFMFGGAGVGKTTAAISFPNCYLIDTEKGAENSQYLKRLKENNGAIYQTCDFNEIMQEVKSLLTEKHEYKTLIIDPLTTVYSDLVDHYAMKMGTDFGRHTVEANKQLKRLLSMLTRLDMTVIVTSHAKTEYGANMAVIGTTFDCYKKLDYLFDLVIEIKKLGLKRFGVVKKTRIATFDEAEEFDFSYNEIAKRYGRDVLEADIKLESLATKKHLQELYHLLDVLRVPDDVVAKWLTKANCDCFEDMSQDLISKCIASLREKIEQKSK